MILFHSFISYILFRTGRGDGWVWVSQKVKIQCYCESIYTTNKPYHHSNPISPASSANNEHPFVSYHLPCIVAVAVGVVISYINNIKKNMYRKKEFMQKHISEKYIEWQYA